MWYLKCECGQELVYTNKRSWYNAKRLGASCKPCQNKKVSNTLKRKYKSGEWKPTPPKSDFRERKQYFRNCPKCGKQLGYGTKYKLQTANKNKTICNSCSSYIYKKNWKNVITEDNIKKMRAAKAGYSSWEEYVEKYPEKQMYKREVWRLTYKNPLETLDNWNKRGRCGVKGAYQLDHIVSINEGYERGIDPHIIAQFSNLRMIPWKQNRSKGA